MRGSIFFIIFLPTLVLAQKKPSGQNACELIKGPLDCSIVEKNVRKLLQGDDNCVLALIDSVCSDIIRTGDRTFLVTLDTIATNSDGYVAEYLLDIGVKLFYEKLPLLTHYLIGRDLKKPGAIERLMVESMSMYLTTSNAPDKKREKIKSFVEQQRIEKKISDQEYAYLENLMKRFDPKMFD
jgi:hypothetical protein